MNLKKNKNTQTNKPITLNFLETNEFDKSKFGKIVKWALRFGKAIVFITFSILIGILFYRAVLDQKIENLTDSIDENIEAISQYSDVEYKIRKAQDKTDIIDEIFSQSINYNLILNKLESSLPKTSSLESIDINPNGLAFRGICENEIVFSSFLSALKKQEEFGEITVSEMTSGGDINPEIYFSINISLLKQ